MLSEKIFNILEYNRTFPKNQQYIRSQDSTKRQALHELHQEGVFGGIEDAFTLPDRLSVLWTGSTGNQIFSSPTVVNGMVYVGSEDGKLYSFHLPGMLI